MILKKIVPFYLVAGPPNIFTGTLKSAIKMLFKNVFEICDRKMYSLIFVKAKNEEKHQNKFLLFYSKTILPIFEEKNNIAHF